MTDAVLMHQPQIEETYCKVTQKPNDAQQQHVHTL